MSVPREETFSSTTAFPRLSFFLRKAKSRRERETDPIKQKRRRERRRDGRSGGRGSGGTGGGGEPSREFEFNS